MYVFTVYLCHLYTSFLLLCANKHIYKIVDTQTLKTLCRTLQLWAQRATHFSSTDYLVTVHRYSIGNQSLKVIGKTAVSVSV